MHEIFKNEDELSKIFELLNYKARLVGGCVRDYIKLNILVDDIDIATEYKPEEVIEKLSNNFKVLPIGLQHGTVTIVGKRKYEITTLRKDEITNGRHAIVNYDNVTYKDDASRRDFTINAIYLDYEGNIYDYFNSLNDLKNNLVKFINNPKQRIQEDYLRIMRFFRFVMRFGNYDYFSLESCYFLMDNLNNISKERITSEWFKILEGHYFIDFYYLLHPLLNVMGLKIIDLFKNFKNLSSLGKTFFFQSVNSKLLLSNAQKTYLKNLNLPLLNKAQALYYYNKYEIELIKDLMIINNVNYDNLIKIPNLPIKGDELISLGFKGKDIKDKIKQLELIWYEQFPNITKEKLLEFI